MTSRRNCELQYHKSYASYAQSQSKYQLYSGRINVLLMSPAYNYANAPAKSIQTELRSSQGKLLFAQFATKLRIELFCLNYFELRTNVYNRALYHLIAKSNPINLVYLNVLMISHYSNRHDCACSDRDLDL